MSFNKKFFTTGGIVASTPSAPAAFDPLQNFETVTYTGNGGTQKITGYIRKGAAFNGSTSHIDFTSPIPYTNTDLTFSCWIKLDSAFSSGYKTIIGAGDKSTGEGIIRLLLRYDSANSYKIEPVRSYSGNSYYDASSSYAAQTINAGSWYNIIYTYSASGNTAKIYINGSLISTTSLTTTSTDSTNSGVLALGQFRDGTSSALFWDGSIDQVRIFDKALSQGEVDTLEAETYASSTKSTTDIFGDGSGIALYELDEDALSSNFEQAVVPASIGYVLTPSGVYNASTGNSISVWFKSNNSNYSTVVYTRDSSTAAGWHIRTSTSGTGINWSWQNSSGSVVFASGEETLTLNDNNWHHIVAVWDGTTTPNAAKLYIDGSEFDTLTASSALSGETFSKGITLGNDRQSNNRPAAGIDQVRVYNTTLSSGDVTKLYNESADVPTANLVAHYKLDGDATDETETYDGTASNVTYSAGVYGGTPTNVNFLGMAFQPDLVWIKERDNSNPHELSDSVRGVSGTLNTNATNAEYINASFQITSLDTNGFTVVDDSAGNYAVNGNGIDYVAWCWKAGGSVTPNNNTNGTCYQQQ
jgi:hypothetical protein